MTISRRTFFLLSIGSLASFSVNSKPISHRPYIIDDLSQPAPTATMGTQWSLVSDRVMGGVSKGVMSREIISGRSAIRMRGEVSLENNGGFVQIGIDLDPNGGAFDASRWQGLEIDVLGNNEEYNAHFRTPDLTRPWQSYRQTFRAEPTWRTIKLPFQKFKPYRTEIPMDVGRLRRLGLIAIGRVFSADLAVGGVRFYSNS